MIIGFVGMTHLGLISAVGAAEKGFDVVCFDPHAATVEQLKKGKLPVNEPQLPELAQKNKQRLQFTADPQALRSCDLVYIAPDIETDSSGKSNLEPIRSLVKTVTPFLKNEALLVILSQVCPGFTRQLNWDPSKLFYQVETLIFGQAIERTLKPERYIIGQADPHAPLPPTLVQFLSAFECPILPMRYESAELAKIAINMFLVSSVATTNTIAELCEKIGANWHEIAPCLKLDKRIGQHAYLAPGLGLSGGNLERDLATFSTLAEEAGTDFGVVRAWTANASHRRDWVLKTIYESILPRSRDPIISILGLAYKANTASIKNSPSLALISHLRNFALRVYDPLVKSLPDCYPNIQSCHSADEACEGVDILVLMTPWDEFKKLSIPHLKKIMAGKEVIDPFGILNREECLSQNINYYKLGL